MAATRKKTPIATGFTPTHLGRAALKLGHEQAHVSNQPDYSLNSSVTTTTTTTTKLVVTTGGRTINNMMHRHHHHYNYAIITVPHLFALMTLHLFLPIMIATSTNTYLPTPGLTERNPRAPIHRWTLAEPSSLMIPDNGDGGQNATVQAVNLTHDEAVKAVAAFNINLSNLDSSNKSSNHSNAIGLENGSSGSGSSSSSSSSYDLTTLTSITNKEQQQLDAANESDRPLIMGVIIANFVIFVIGLCGNTVVILVILKFTRIETVTDIYILNLAFADLMFIMGLIFLITTMFIDHWVFGNVMCKIYMATTSLNQFASSLLLVVMSFDRFLAVCHPIYAQRFRRLRRAKIICLCIWIVCLVLMTPIFAFAKINHELTCAIFWPEHKGFNCELAFTMYSFAIGFAVPLLLIAAFYLCVIRKLRLAASGAISMGSSRRSRSRESTNRRIEHLVIGIICTYTICWLPYWISQLAVSFNTVEWPEFYVFVLIATSLSYTNSALNPILYAFLSDNFKRRCSDIIRTISSFKWFRSRSTTRLQQQQQQQQQLTGNNHHSRYSYCGGNYPHLAAESDLDRPESRQTVVYNEQSSTRLAPSPSQPLTTITTVNVAINSANSGLCTYPIAPTTTTDSSNRNENPDNNSQQSQQSQQPAKHSSNNHEIDKEADNQATAEARINLDELVKAAAAARHQRKKSVAFSVKNTGIDTIAVVQSLGGDSNAINHHACDMTQCQEV